MNISLTMEKARKVKDACAILLNKSSPTMREVAQVLGFLTSSMPGVMYANSNPAAVRYAFEQRFPDRKPPLRTTILRNVEKYLNAGMSLKFNRGNPGRRTVRSAENIDAVRDLLEHNPHVSVRRNPIPISHSALTG